MEVVDAIKHRAALARIAELSAKNTELVNGWDGEASQLRRALIAIDEQRSALVAALEAMLPTIERSFPDMMRAQAAQARAALKIWGGYPLTLEFLKGLFPQLQQQLEGMPLELHIAGSFLSLTKA
jgi:hypothetical protein